MIFADQQRELFSLRAALLEARRGDEGQRKHGRLW
jgi:hypothetical protein